MFFKPPPESAPAPRARRPAEEDASERGGIVARVRAASGAASPQPGAKRIVLLLVGVLVAGAIIYQFASGRRFRATPPAAESPPAGPVGASPPPLSSSDAAVPPDAPFTFPLDTGGALETPVGIADAAALLARAPPEEAEALRAKALRTLCLAARGPRAREALEGVLWLLGARLPDDTETLLALTQAAHAGLARDATAPAALRLFSALPEQGGSVAWTAIDRVLLDESRALHVRIAAAAVRPVLRRPPEIEALLTDPRTHPLLREALAH